jgi:hypothetical protein
MQRRRFLQTAGGLLAVPALRTAEPAFPPARAVTKGPKHHFFGYYDKTPWDKSGRYLLAMEIDFNDRQPVAGEALTLGMVDLKDNNRYLPFDKTLAWSWQQGTMLQWLGSAPDREVIYNSVADGKYVATVRDVHSGKTRTLNRPVYGVSPDGKQAVTLDFDRLQRLRPGYGYCALPEEYRDEAAPKNAGIYHVDVASGKDRLIIPIRWAAGNKPDERFTPDSHHWFNHLVFNPSGTHFIFLHRWKKPDARTWFTRLYVAAADGSERRLVWDHGMVSHFDWRDDHSILAWARDEKKHDRFFVHDLKTDKREVFSGDFLTRDGHCSYSPDRKWVLNDTYPDEKRLQTLMLVRVSDGKRIDIGKFHLPPKLTGPFRCDLHPRWNRDGTQVCIDSGHEATRQVYVLDVSEYTKA